MKLKKRKQHQMIKATMEKMRVLIQIQNKNNLKTKHFLISKIAIVPEWIFSGRI